MYCIEMCVCVYVQMTQEAFVQLLKENTNLRNKIWAVQQNKFEDDNRIAHLNSILKQALVETDKVSSF